MLRAWLCQGTTSMKLAADPAGMLVYSRTPPTSTLPGTSITTSKTGSLPSLTSAYHLSPSVCSSRHGAGYRAASSSVSSSARWAMRVCLRAYMTDAPEIPSAMSAITRAAISTREPYSRGRRVPPLRGDLVTARNTSSTTTKEHAS